MLDQDLAILCVFLLLVFIFVVAIVIRYRKRVAENVQLKVQFEKVLLQTQLEIQEQTLKTLSQEIHDNIGQVLSLAKLNLNVITNVNEPAFADTKKLISKAINDLRDLSRSMQGDRIAEQGLQQSVAFELEIMQNTGRYKTVLQVKDTPYRLPVQQEIILFRMVQEALSNIIRHADAQNVKVTFEYAPTQLVLVIADDGKGLLPGSVTHKPGIGLINMKSRIALIGGALSVDSGSSAGGYRITIALPR